MKSDAQQDRSAVNISFDVGGDEHRKSAAVGRHQIDGDACELALQLQQRREMGFVVYEAAYGQQVRERLVDQRVSLVTKPRQKRRVHVDDAPVRPCHDVAARRILVQVFGTLAEDRPRCHVAPTNSAMACAVMSGALSWGQWPMASSVTSSLPSIRCWT